MRLHVARCRSMPSFRLTDRSTLMGSSSARGTEITAEGHPDSPRSRPDGIRFHVVVMTTSQHCTDWAHCSSVFSPLKRTVAIWVQLQCESKKSPLRFSEIFPKRLGIFNKFFTHLLCYNLYTRLRIFIQISPTMTKLCHTKRDHLANFYISLEL